MGCAETSRVLGFLRAGLQDEQAGSFQHHVDGCGDCRELLTEYGRAFFSTGPNMPSAEVLTIGESVDRYLVVGWLGKGGMGIVYRAYDPRLDRLVALKLRRTWTRDRLLTEARCMAKVAHPHVVAIHDAGVHGDHVYLIEELVEGETLDLCVAKQRDRDRIVKLYLQAGRGLAAAHAAGLVHGDFKPQNVLVDAEGRAKVTDFGLASDLTSGACEAIGGTPRYMAPEQQRGQATPWSDQYSFCVALREALGKGAPRRMLKVLERGTNEDATKRFPSMDALLAALERDPIKRWRWAAAASLVLLTGMGATALLVRHRHAAVSMCEGFESRLSGIWDEPRKDRLVSTLSSAMRPGEEETASSVARALDDWARRWIGVKTDTCRATQITKEQPREVLDARMACLDAQLHEARTLVDGLLGTSRRDQAALAARSLSPPESCIDTHTTLSVDPAERAEVAVIEQHIAEAKGLRTLGRFREGAERLAEAEKRASAIHHRRSVARVSLFAGDLQTHLGHHADAERLFRQSVLAGEAGRADDVVARAWGHLVGLYAYELARPDEARRAMEHADAALERLGPNDEVAGQVHQAIGIALELEGKHEEALARSRRALGHYRATARGPNFNVSAADDAIGHELVMLGRFDEASPFLEESLAIRKAVFGDNHPRIASAVDALGLLRYKQGHLREATELHRLSVDLCERVEGKKCLASSLHNLGEDQFAQGLVPEALATFSREVTTVETLFGRDHPLLARALLHRAEIAPDLDSTVPDARRAVGILEMKTRDPNELSEAKRFLARALARRKHRGAR